jgi:hypothetical protein
MVACRLAGAQLSALDLLDQLTFERCFVPTIASFSHGNYPTPQPPGKNDGREGLWKVPHPWKSAKNADSHTMLGKASHKTARLSHTYHSPDDCDPNPHFLLRSLKPIPLY